MKFLTLLLTCLSAVLLAQPVEFGIKGGAVLSEPIRYSYDESRRYTIGATVELHLPRNFAVEAGFLYKRIGNGFSFLTGDTPQSVWAYSNRGNSFEVPVIGKYYFRPASRVTPFVGLGASVRRTWQSGSFTTQPPTNVKFSDVSPFGVGAVGNAGLRFKYGPVKLSPEIRYTRWSAETQRMPRNPNQLEVLFGVSF